MLSPSVWSRGLDADSPVGIDALPHQSEAHVSFRPTAATPWSHAPFRLDRMFPVEGQVSVPTLPKQSEAIQEQSSERSRISKCVSPGATDATVSDHARLCSGSASELSEYQRCLPREKRANGRPLSREGLTALSVPNRGSGRVGALQPKLHDDQRAQTVTGLVGQLA